MKQKLLIILLILSSILLHSQNSIWKTNINDAIVLSNEQRKPLLIFFTAYGVSQAIQNEVFSTPNFTEWSVKNVILLKLDLSDSSLSNDEKELNFKLKEALGVLELPQVCIVRASVRKSKPTIDKLGMLDYKIGGAKNWISDVNTILQEQ